MFYLFVWIFLVLNASWSSLELEGLIVVIVFEIVFMVYLWRSVLRKSVVESKKKYVWQKVQRNKEPTVQILVQILCETFQSPVQVHFALTQRLSYRAGQLRAGGPVQWAPVSPAKNHHCGLGCCFKGFVSASLEKKVKVPWQSEAISSAIKSVLLGLWVPAQLYLPPLAVMFPAWLSVALLARDGGV